MESSSSSSSVISPGASLLQGLLLGVVIRTIFLQAVKTAGPESLESASKSVAVISKFLEEVIIELLKSVPYLLGVPFQRGTDRLQLLILSLSSCCGSFPPVVATDEIGGMVLDGLK